MTAGGAMTKKGCEWRSAGEKRERAYLIPLVLQQAWKLNIRINKADVFCPQSGRLRCGDLRGLRGRSAECGRSALKPLLKGEVARSAGGVEAKPSLPEYKARRGALNQPWSLIAND